MNAERRIRLIVPPGVEDGNGPSTSCHTNQSPASSQTGVASYTRGSCVRVSRTLGKNHSSPIVPP